MLAKSSFLLQREENEVLWSWWETRLEFIEDICDMDRQMTI